jgi:predicted dehydrogenase
MSYVTTKFFDVTGDGEDEAFVILKVGTGSITIPQIVYIYEWKEGKPDLIWYFRTGDRAAGGLKRIYGDEGNLVVELFGRDRYIFTQMETSKIVGDEEHVCCPTHFTRTIYKRQGKRFVLQGDRLTFSLEDTDAEPVRNMNDKKLKEERGSKQ